MQPQIIVEAETLKQLEVSMEELTFAENLSNEHLIFLDNIVDLDLIDVEENFDIHHYFKQIEKGLPIEPVFE